ncbi:MAG TPA: 3-oxoacyl-ACP reductase FabG [Dehalococcoidia bacterium]|jgi:3-oxoacyl-[acyl-carrier protein] reductase|nr:3-oxoacyl-ACP reductase FabG [Dehalococcoidia bacterium]
MSIEGKVALVTGGSGGLGRVHCLTLARAGCNVALTGHSHLEKAEAVAEEIRKMGRKALAVKMDLANLDEVQAGVKQVEETLGPVDILVNNAAFGIVRAVTIVNMDIKDWERDLAVNLTGAFNTIKCCMPGMMERGWGRIINISSIAGTMGGMGQCSYAATKAGLIGLTKTAALEGARKGVTCNALVLGVFDGGSFYEVAPEFRERIIKRMAMRRAGDPQELSNVLVFLASEESSYITGEAIEVSGGASLFTF